MRFDDECILAIVCFQGVQAKIAVRETYSDENMLIAMVMFMEGDRG